MHVLAAEIADAAQDDEVGLVLTLVDGHEAVYALMPLARRRAHPPHDFRVRQFETDQVGEGL